jgi:hypothetical protein
MVVALTQAGAASARLPREFYGVNAPVAASSKQAARMARGGVSTVRFPFGWRSIEPTETGGYHWAFTDLQVKRYARRQLRVLPVLFATPSWLTSNYRRPPLKSKQARARWRQLLQAAVGRYGPGGAFWVLHPTLPYKPIRYWQIWNEPNIPGFFAPKPSPKRYERLLQISANAIRGASSKAKVVLAGLPHTAERPGQIVSYRFLRQLYRRGARGEFDVIAIHPYALGVGGVNGVKDQLERMRKVADRHGDAKLPIWIDEIGWASTHQRGNPFAAGRHGQARKLRQTFRFVLDHRRNLKIQRLMWFKWRDSEVTPGCAFCAAGLLSKHLHPKPAWGAFKRFADR